MSKRQADERDPTKLYISASQLDSFTDCPRQWWFKRVMRLKETQKGYFTFGTVMHACIERFLAATENGRVPEATLAQTRESALGPVWNEGPLDGQRPGDPVNLFPDGWETITEKGETVSVTPNEALLIRKLVNSAIEKGIIARVEGQEVEREIKLPVIDGVILTGFADIFRASSSVSHIQSGDRTGPFLLGTPELHDHKSFSESGARYLKQPGPKDEGGNNIEIDAPYKRGDGTSPNSVGHNQQLLTYAAATSIMDGYEGPVLVRHNQYPKFDDPKKVRYVDALVSRRRLIQHWAWIQEQAAEMVKVAKIKLWTDTPGPRKDDACQRYGGCPFVKICGMRETPEAYAEKVAIQLSERAGQPSPNLNLSPRKRNKPGGKKEVGKDIFERVRNQKTKSAEPTAPAPAGAPAATEALAGPAAQATAPVAGAPAAGAPWANPVCPACKGLGVNTKGRPCPICDTVAKKAGRPTSLSYNLSSVNGLWAAKARPESAQALLEAGAPLEWLQGAAQGTAVAPAGAAPATVPAKATKKQTKAEAPAAALAPAPEPEAADEVEEEPVEAEEAEEPVEAEAPAATVPAGAPKTQAKAGRPRVGLTILIGAAQLRGPQRQSLTAQELLEQIGAELAADMGAESYWALETFKRRDRIRQRAELIAERLGKVVLIVPGTSDPDVSFLVSSLIPHADLVIEGLR